MRRLTGLILTGLIVIAVSSALAQPPGDPDAAAPGETITGSDFHTLPGTHPEIESTLDDGNRFGHPAPAVLQRYRERHAVVVGGECRGRTSRDGAQQGQNGECRNDFHSLPFQSEPQTTMASLAIGSCGVNISLVRTRNASINPGNVCKL